MSEALSYLQTWQPQTLSSEATALPAQMYACEAIYRLEQQNIFGKAWYSVGHRSQLQGPGSYFTVEIAEQPLVILQDQTGQLRGFFNVCPHRAGPVAAGSGKLKQLTCLYHAWSFDLAGKLQDMPDLESAENFDPESHCLRAVKVEAWGPFLFVNLDPNCQPLATQLGELPELFGRYRFSDWARVYSVDYWTDTNWKLYVENNVESYHEPAVHAVLSRYYKHTTAEARHYYYLQYAPLPPDDVLHRFLRPGFHLEGLSEPELHGKSTVSLFPNFAWILRPYVAIIYLIDPQGPSRTRVRWDWLVPDTETARDPQNLQPLVEFFDQIQQEDLRLLPAIQRRILSRGYRPGRLSPSREVGVHLFQELVLRHLSRRFEPVSVP